MEIETPAQDVLQPNKRFKKDHNTFHLKSNELDYLKYANETGLYESNLFKLQLDELIKEINISASKQEEYTATVNQLVKALKNLKPKQNLKYSDLQQFEKIGIEIPLSDLLKSFEEGTYSFLPPTNVKPIGSYALNSMLKKPNQLVDLLVEMPNEFFTERDYLNYRYFMKRNLYLAHVYLQLVDKKKYANLKFEFTSDYSSQYKPLLVIKFDEQLEVALHFVPNCNSFKLHRFNPNQTNVRTKWFQEKFKTNFSEEQSNLDHPNPLYNYELLKDIRALENNEHLKQHLNSESLQQACQLVKLWLCKRNLNKGYGSFDSFIVSMFISHLVTTKKINEKMTPFHIFRMILVQLSEMEWNKNALNMISSESSLNKTDLNEYFKHYEIVFIDPSGYLNICSKLDRTTFEKVKHEAKLCSNFIKQEPFDCLDKLFIKNHSFEFSYDSLVRIEPIGLFYSDIVNKTSQEFKLLDNFNNHYCVALQSIKNILFKSVESRANLIYIKTGDDLKWPIGSKPDENEPLIQIGILFNDSYDNNLIKGPASTLPEANEFRRFWGSKSELRRFQDTSICEAVYFETQNISQKRTIYADIIRFTFRLHLSIDEKCIRFYDKQIDALLTLPTGIIDNYGTGEEKLSDAVNTYNEFSKILRNLKDLPLNINNVNGLSSVFRLTDVFAPMSCCFNYDLKDEKYMCYKLGNKLVPKYPLGSVLPPYVKPLKIVCQLEASGKWPDDLECIKRLKTAFYLEIAKTLKNHYGLLALASLDYCDILYKGFVFRLSVCTMSELLCLKSSLNEQGIMISKETEESINYEKKMIYIPKLTNFLYSIQHKYAAFNGVCRIAKRWLASHYLFDYFEEEAIDLICAYLFVNPQTTVEQPKSILSGFVRFLDTMASFDWKNQFLIVNFNNELLDAEAKEIRDKFRTERNSLPPVFILTQVDDVKKKCLWTSNKPDIQQLCRVVLLANQSLQKLKKVLMNFESTEELKNIFRPNIDIFDLEIELKAQYCVKAYQKLDITKGTFLPHYKTYNAASKEVTVYPVVNFDPVELYVNELRKSYGEIGYFFYDVYGDTTIQVLWKRNVLKQTKEITKENSKFFIRDKIKNTLDLNLEHILNDFQLMGKELIHQVRIKNSTFE